MGNKHGYGGRTVATAAASDRGEAVNVAGLSIAAWIHGPLAADAGEDSRVTVRAVYGGVPQRDEVLDRLPPTLKPDCGNVTSPKRPLSCTAVPVPPGTAPA